MIRVMLVDDEILALEYLKNLIDWEAHGYHVVGTAVNGRKAMELYGKTVPEIVITDIKMAGMDGLELARLLKEKNPDVIVILLSAYRDFEYAQKGIRYGVSNYLLKHELCEETLLEELKKTEKNLDLTKKRKKMYQKYLMNQLIYGRPAGERFYDEKMGEKLFLLMIHKRSRFSSGEFITADWNLTETRIMEEELPQIEIDGVSYVTDTPVTPDNWVVLCRMAHVPSTQASDDKIRQWAETLIAMLSGASNQFFHAICSRKIETDDISQVYRLMSRQVRQAFFWKPNTSRFVESVPEEEKVLWGEQIRKLEHEVCDEAGAPGNVVRQLLEELWAKKRMEASRSLLSQINNLLQEMAVKTGAGIKPAVCTSMDEIIRYYADRFEELHGYLFNQAKEKYSRVVAEVISYIRKHYKKELSLEILGEEFHMNGVYLGQIFKKEVGLTVLKYQTALRMEEAKRLLREENCTVSETARLVGYQTSQYFSQVFARNTGQKPQEYRNKG